MSVGANKLNINNSHRASLGKMLLDFTSEKERFLREDDETNKMIPQATALIYLILKKINGGH